MTPFNDTGLTFTGSEAQRIAQIKVAFARLAHAQACIDDGLTETANTQLAQAINELKRLIK